jgi:glycosyltransferase involved in cell wall biosynthesis
VSIRHYDVLIKAWTLVWKSTGARLLILGDGPDADQLRELVQRLGLSGAVDFLGFVHDVYQRMSGAAAYVSLSSIEGHPNATTEAAAVGCPLVLSDIPEHRNLFTAAEARFVAHDAPDRVAETILEVIRNRSDSALRAGAARRRAREAASADVPGIYDRLLRELALHAAL